MSLRHSSSGGRAAPGPGLMLISPSGFTASPPEGRNPENASSFPCFLLPWLRPTGNAQEIPEQLGWATLICSSVPLLLALIFSF